MSITEFATLVRRRLIIITLVGACTLGGAVVWTLRSPTVYEATATLFVSVSSRPMTLPVEDPEGLLEAIEESRQTGPGQGGQQQLPQPPPIQFVTPDVRPVDDEVIDSYAELAGSEPLLRRAAEALERPDSAPSLSGKVTVSHPPQSQLIDVSARDGDPEGAAEIATAVGREISRSVRRWESEPGLDSPVRINLAVPAAVPGSPASPNPSRNILFGLVLGLALGLAAAILREIFDTRLRDPTAVRDLLDLPVLATIDYDRRLRSHPMLLQQADLNEEQIAPERLSDLWARSRVAEEFRQLRVNLEFFSFERQRRSIAVTSSGPNEGKTTTAGNLAITMALAGESVALVDCDLRSPSVNDRLGIEDRPGLTEVLVGQADLDAALVSGRRLSVLSAGAVPPNPAELLGSQAMADLLSELHDRFGVVVIDTPPSLPFADPAVLAPLCGATLLVVRMNHTRADELERAVNTLSGVEARICGAVVNMVRVRGLGRRRHYSYYYTDGKRTISDATLSGSGFADLVPRGVNGAPTERSTGKRPPNRLGS